MSVVELTGEAVDFLHQQLAEMPKAVGMRLSVKTAGCSGHQYVLKPVLDIIDTDLVFPLTGNYTQRISSCDAASGGEHEGVYMQYMTERDNPRTTKSQLERRRVYQLYIDPKSVPYLQGTVIDYIRQGLNRQLTYRNPNEVSSCGCGESFYVEEK